MDTMATITPIYYYETESPICINKDLSIGVIIDTIRENIISQYQHIFGVKPADHILKMCVNGFMLFNLHKNKNMLTSKTELLKYVNNNSISLDEKTYFTDIFLFNQRPEFLTPDEHEYIRACGDLDGFEYDDKNEDDIVDLFDNIENTVSIISNMYNNLIHQ